MTTQTRLRIALGTFVAVEAEACDAETAARSIDSAFEAVLTVERLMHPTRPGSDLAVLRACAPNSALKVHHWTWDVLALCQRLNHSSRGAFDPCLATAAGRITDLELLSDFRVVPRVAMQVDLGGIAKGYAVDRAIDALSASGCHGGLVNAGGDMAAFGARERLVLCRGPQGTDALINLHNAALATGDTRNSARPSEHRGYYHGAHRDTHVSGHASVIAPSAAVADAVTKCVLCAAPGERQFTCALLDEFGARQIDFASERQSQPKIEA
jgi:thiamine biosynthesis lipoprotein